MSGGTIETYLDTDYLVSGTHKGADGSETLYDPGADFESCGVTTELHIANDTQAVYSNVDEVTEDTISTVEIAGGYVVTDGTSYLTTDGTPYVPAGDTESGVLTWNNGDTYYIYRTSAYGTFLGNTVTDLSRGWKTARERLQDGWRVKDIDLDKDGENIFGPGQPE